MKSAVENIDPTRVKLTVEVPLEEIQTHVDQAYKDVAAQVNIPGFRRGKVPPRIIDQRVGRPAVLEQAVNAAMPDLYGQAVADADIKPIGRPSLDVTAVPGITEDANDLVFTVEVDTRPEFSLPELAEVTLTVDDAEVSEADIDDALNGQREHYATLVSVERAAADGDYVTIDMAASIDGEEIDTVAGVSYEIGSGNMLEGLDEALIGLEAGGSTTFEAPLAGGEHAGANAQIEVTVGAVKEQELPEADDDFAQTASEFDTIAELRESLRGQVADAKANNRAVQARDLLLEHLLGATDFPVPTGVIEDEVHSHLEGEGRLEDDEHRAEVTEEATKALRRQLVLDALSEQVEPQVGQQELVEYLLRMAQQSRQDPNEFIANADKNGQIPLFVAELTRNKALAIALRAVSVVDAAGEAVDLSAYIGSDEEDAAAAAAAGNFVDVTGDVEAAAEEAVVVEDDSNEDASDEDSEESKDA
ncbi:trigger factor [Pseudactinotalea sp. HY158]|uniref:trigger factor n=1 Tax=Pseudactinotalea sp. HY158 TaxID=2654547 RepID=UPI00129CEE13|nr:trigger factor [Pseudactinotalea sp. HY158]QGH69977.1 trigger factor [Pseudactinotalea sp. HY158]